MNDSGNQAKPRVPTVRQLVATWHTTALRSHNQARVCPQCKANMLKVGLPDLVYTFESCTCDAATYAHLVEQLWHRECFLVYHSAAAVSARG